MPMTYSILAGAKTTEGSIKSWVNYARLDVGTIIEQAQTLLYDTLRVREMRTLWSVPAYVGDSTKALPTDFLDPNGKLRDTDNNVYNYVATPDMLLMERMYNSGVLSSRQPYCWTIFDEALQFDGSFDTARTLMLPYYRKPALLRTSSEDAGTGNDSFTKILLHFDDVDSSTTITDSNIGGLSHAWTANGNAQIDTADKKFGTSSALFDGNGDYSTSPDSSDFSLGSGDWTVDFWFKINVANNGQLFLCGQGDNSGSVSSTSFYIERSPVSAVMSGYICVGGTTFSVVGIRQFTDAINTGWHHLAFVRTGNFLKLFLDGVQDGTTTTISGTVNNSGNAFSVGRRGEIVNLPWQGWIDEFRMSVGVARWTTTFTPQTIAYGIPPGSPSETNFLTTRYPHLLQQACIVKAYAFMKDWSSSNSELSILNGMVQLANANNDLVYRGSELQTEA